MIHSRLALPASLIALLAAALPACGGTSDTATADTETAVSRVEERTAGELARDCRTDDFEACATLGWLLYADAEGPSDALRIIELFERACTSAAPEGCSGLGVVYFEGFGVSQDFDRAVGYWERACDLESGAGCAYLGVTYLFGLGSAANPARAGRVWTRSCDLGEAAGCRFAGDLFIQNGPARAVDRAVDLWERACLLGDPEGCIALARQLYSGRLVAMDRAMALTYFEEACDLGGSGGCVNAGNLYRYGEGADTDIDVAIGFYARACDLLDTRGCQLQETVAADRDCFAAGRSDCGASGDGVDLLECTGDGGFGVVTLSPDRWRARHGAGVTELRDLRTSLEQPVEVCMLEGQLDFLLGLYCADGSQPFDDRDVAHAARLGNVGPGGRCGRTVDLYAVPCPEGVYQVYIDMYMCPAAEPGLRL